MKTTQYTAPDYHQHITCVIIHYQRYHTNNIRRHYTPSYLTYQHHNFYHRKLTLLAYSSTIIHHNCYDIPAPSYAKIVSTPAPSSYTIILNTPTPSYTIIVTIYQHHHAPSLLPCRNHYQTSSFFTYQHHHTPCLGPVYTVPNCCQKRLNFGGNKKQWRFVMSETWVNMSNLSN